MVHAAVPPLIIVSFAHHGVVHMEEAKGGHAQAGREWWWCKSLTSFGELVRGRSRVTEGRPILGGAGRCGGGGGRSGELGSDVWGRVAARVIALAG